MADVDIGTIYEEVAVAEDCSTYLLFPIDKYESVTVTDVPTLDVEFTLQLSATCPVLEITAEFDRLLQGDSKIPTLNLSGAFGYRLNSNVPVRSLTGSITSSESLALNSKLPTSSVSGRFGARLDRKIPTCSLSAEFDLSVLMSLDKHIPLLKLASTMYEVGTLSLDQNIPLQKLTASIDLAGEILSLDLNIPCCKLAGTIYEEGSLSLDAEISSMLLEATMYGQTLELDSYAPLLTITGGVVETKPDVHPLVDVTSDSFIGVLRYIRP